MLRYNSPAASAEGDVWQPTDECALQIETEDPEAVADVMARVHPDANWTTVHTFRDRQAGIVRLAKLPYMKIVVRRNTAGKALTVWDAE